jgi:MtaA/CmuA family methyltransferase
MNSRERITAFLKGGEVDSIPFLPITMMFAADQIGVKYGDYVRDHRLMVEGQLRTTERFDTEHVSGISDPTREAADLGAAIAWFDDQPPSMMEHGALLADKRALATLKVPDPLGGGRMHDRVEAMALFRRRVGRDKIVEGWIEGPANQGSNLRGIHTLMLDFHDDPGFVRDLFDFIAGMEIAFGRAQIEAGADVIGMGDPSSSLVGPRIYDEFVQPCQKRIVDALHAAGALVRLHICGNTRKMTAAMARTGADIIDLDSMSPIAEARAAMGPAQVLNGNIDPVRTLCRGPVSEITARIADCHAAAGARYTVGAGCEVPRDTPTAHMLAMRDYARSHKP